MRLTYVIGTGLPDGGGTNKHVGLVFVVPPQTIVQHVLVLLAHEVVLNQ